MRWIVWTGLHWMIQVMIYPLTAHLTGIISRILKEHTAWARIRLWVHSKFQTNPRRRNSQTYLRLSRLKRNIKKILIMSPRGPIIRKQTMVRWLRTMVSFPRVSHSLEAISLVILSPEVLIADQSANDLPQTKSLGRTQTVRMGSHQNTIYQDQGWSRSSGINSSSNTITRTKRSY